MWVNDHLEVKCQHQFNNVGGPSSVGLESHRALIFLYHMPQFYNKSIMINWKSRIPYCRYNGLVTTARFTALLERRDIDTHAMLPDGQHHLQLILHIIHNLLETAYIKKIQLVQRMSNSFNLTAMLNRN